MRLEEKTLAKFPKHRPELPEAYQAIYVSHYKQNREGASPATSLARRMETWMHRQVAEDVVARPGDYRTLEVGAGSLNHLPYEPQSVHYEVVEPFVELYENSPYRSRVANVYGDLADISSIRFDRVISIAAFEHFCDLPSAVARCGLLLASDGRLRVAVPSEGTLLWRLGWSLTTGVEFRLRNRLDYGVLMRHEHVNTAKEIAQILGLFFNSIRRKVLGVSPALSFYQFFECAGPRADRCANYLERNSLSLAFPSLD